jgi:hypothetical protein
MFRVIVTILGGAVLGWGLGGIQSTWRSGQFEERFVLNRSSSDTAAEASVIATDGSEPPPRPLPSGAEGSLPQVEIEGGTEYRFGTMRHGESLSHGFVFRNVGNGPLTLKMGGSTCKCTIGELQNSVLQPGEETTVTLTWTAQTVTDEYGQSATIHTSDPEYTEVDLRVVGQIVDSYVFEPSSIALGEFSVTDGIERSFYVLGYLEGSETLHDLTWANETSRRLVNLKYEKVPVDTEKFPNHRTAVTAFKVDLKIEPGMPIGPLNSRITFATDQGEKVGTLEIPVSGRVTGDILLFGGGSFDPATNVLTIGAVKSSEGARVSVALAIQGAQRDAIVPEVASVKPAESLKVNLSEPKVQGSRKVYSIYFEVPKGAPETYYSGSNPKDFGKVIIKLNDEFTQEVTIHVRMNVVK